VKQLAIRNVLEKMQKLVNKTGEEGYLKSVIEKPDSYLFNQMSSAGISDCPRKNVYLLAYRIFVIGIL